MPQQPHPFETRTMRATFYLFVATTLAAALLIWLSFEYSWP